MKNFHYLLVFCASLSLLTLSSCEDDLLNDLEQDIIGEWVVDDYVFSGNNLSENGVIDDMRFIFDSNLGVEVSWFEGNEFFIVVGDWSGDEADPSLSIDLENDVFFFCDDNDITFNVFFFAGDMQLDTDCGGDDWMEIQLERL